MAEAICAIHVGQETLQAISLLLEKRELTLTGGVLMPLREHAAPEPPTANEKPPAETEEEEEAPGTDEELSAAVKGAVRALRLGKADAYLALPKQQGILRSALLPSTDEDELAQMARFEIERHIPFHQERHYSGYHVMRSMGVEGSEVLLGAVDGPIVDRAVHAAIGAGLKPAGVTLSSVALVNALLFEKREALAGKTVAALNVGLDALDIVLLTDDRVRFARSVGFDLRGVLETWSGFSADAGGRLSEDKLALAAKSIDCMDLEARYNPEESGAAAGADGPERVRAWITRLIQELRRTYDFARREMKCPPIEMVFLSGEGARLRNLTQYLAGNLNVEMAVLNPIASLPGAAALKFPFDGLEFALPLGAALSSPQGSGEPEMYQLDLIPPEHYRMQARRHTLKRLILTGGLLVLGVGLGLGAWSRLAAINDRIFDDYDELNRKMNSKVAELAEMKTKTGIIERFQQDPNAALPVLGSIANSRMIPGSVTLSSIEYKKGNADEAGTIEIQGDARTLPDINTFMDDLRASGHFSDSLDMKSDPGQMYGQPLYNFTIDAQLSDKSASATKHAKGAGA